MSLRLKLLTCAVWLAAVAAYVVAGRLPAATAAQEKKIDFHKDVAPIFEAACNNCHAGAKAKAGLRLDAKTSAMQGGASGAAIVPGNSRESLLMQRVRGEGGAPRMPPGGQLTEEQVNQLAAWIDQGAEWPDASAVQAKATAQASSAAQTVDFVKDVQPIFQSSCYACHSGAQPKAGLRLDAKALAMKGGISGSAIVPGKADESRLIHRVEGLHNEPRMPMGGEPLKPEQIANLRRWIDQGAAWPDDASAADAKIETHWAFVSPHRPEVPKVQNAAWARNPIDNFVLARLEKEGLKPSPEADKVTLLRRVSYDLTGLPPTPAEIDSFLADQSPDAYEERVDKLLASPHYGERMAMQWLDLARYADTHGFHIDSHRDMWPWRDWVIKSFNQNKPYDQFTVEQLAGDLLPQATLDQQIASGFNRNHMINFEGGAIPEEYQVEYVVDRVETTSTVWMGLTMGCARCHNHKYDPITQKDFYRFFAFFNTVAEKGLDGRTGNAKPFLPLPTDEQKAQMAQLGAAIKATQAILNEKEDPPADPKNEDEKRLVTVPAPGQEEWEKKYIGQIALATREGLVAHYELDGNFSDMSGRYQQGRTLQGDPTFGGGRVGRAVNFDGDSHVGFGDVGSFDRGQAFTLAIWMRPSSNTPIAGLHKLGAAETRRGYELFFDDLELIGIQRRAARLNVKLTDRWPASAIHLRTVKKLALGEWHHLTVAHDGSGKAAQLRIYVDGKPVETETLQDNLAGSFKTSGELGFGNKQFGKPYKGGVDDLRVYDRLLRPEEVEQLAVHFPIQGILSGVFGKPSKEDAARVRDYYLTYAAPENLRAEYVALKQLKKQREKLEKQILTVMVMGEQEKPRETFVLARGDYRNRTDKVTAGVPAVLPALPKGAGANRLALAKWLVDPAHPLTARVAVNRYWQMYFGTGLVKTVENFGMQGEPPSHPELLDWLATEFTRTKWDVRAMQRLIVTSATYRQASKLSPELREKDPENRLLARGPRFRLPAEMIRDGALVAGGLINDKIGGPSVSPYQPDGLWEELAFGDGFTAQSYEQSTGRDLYRRSMYTFWKRTAPPAMLSTFDAPDREKCTARRTLTNTPLQALVLLNDPTFVEAARALAERALRDGGRDTMSRIAYAFRAATARQPSAQETRILRELLTQQLAHYRRDKASATLLLGVGEHPRDQALDETELAAWTTVASAILNLDETVTKE